MINQYRVVIANTFEELEREVNDRLKVGWQLRGELIVSSGEVGEYVGQLAQVMTTDEIET